MTYAANLVKTISLAVMEHGRTDCGTTGLVTVDTDTGLQAAIAG
jgi:hypothetical protein